MNIGKWAGFAFAVGVVCTVGLAAEGPVAPGAGVPRPPPMSSEELAKQPQTPGATGDQERHYYFAEAGVESPYHLYVPKGYDGKKKLPLVLAMHGAVALQNYFFRPAYGTPDMLEKHDFIFVTPFGYDEFVSYRSMVTQRPPA